jgi:hypothetical protein
MPCVLGLASPTHGLLNILGEMTGVFFVPGNQGGDNLVSEDRLIVNGEVYRVFQSGSRTDNWNWWALKED